MSRSGLLPCLLLIVLPITGFAQGYALNAFPLDDHRAQIAWDGDAVLWTLDRIEPAGDTLRLGQFPGHVRSTIDEGLTIELSYTYRLTAMTAGSSFVYTQTSVVTKLASPALAGILPLGETRALVWWEQVDENAEEIILETKEFEFEQYRDRIRSGARLGWLQVSDLVTKRPYSMRLRAVTPYNRAEPSEVVLYEHVPPMLDWIFLPAGGPQGYEKHMLMTRGEIDNSTYEQFCIERDLPLPDHPDFPGVQRYMRRFPFHPVVKVNWYDAIQFCNWVSEKMALPPAYSDDASLRNENGIRIPTWDEWQHAASLAGGRYPWGSSPPGRSNANYLARNRKLTAGEPPTLAPADIEPGPSGITHLAGNVWEWCFDWAPNENPDDDKQRYRIVAGGSWMDPPARLRNDRFAKLTPTIRSNTVGLRVIRNAPVPVLKVETVSLAEGAP
ncbi:SUMF1/EgtB/PvdO family nonheme iron enzyme [bacterium]|nr:SUMF1/EgtB/PvdO family nonheme iron enzyme [bacterium]